MVKSSFSSVKKPSVSAPKKAHKKKATPTKTGRSGGKNSVDGGSVRDKICRSLVDLAQMKMMGPRKTLVAPLAGYPGVNSGFIKACGQLKKAGMITSPTKETMSLTAKGMEHYRSSSSPRTPISYFKDNIELHCISYNIE